MAAIPFVTLALARKLEQAGFPAAQAQDTLAALAGVMGQAQLVTGEHMDMRFRELDLRLKDLEQRLTNKLGTMVVASVVAVASLVKLL
ncbi:MAG: hypothetical protein JWP04_2802 [Belnapia sp.]|nr:hypothetical protein [Belnapia sp.]